MTVKILMSKLWPKAGGRTRAVMLRNQNIKDHITDDLEMYILEKTDDALEKIVEAKKRFHTSFNIKDIYSEVRYEKTYSEERYLNTNIVMSHLAGLSKFDFKIFDNNTLINIYSYGEKVLSFWSSNAFNQVQKFGSFYSWLSYLISHAKVVIGFTNNIKTFRVVNDMNGLLMNFGKYDNAGKHYVKEIFVNIYGQKIYESYTDREKKMRSFFVYVYNGGIFEGINAENKVAKFLTENVLQVKNKDVLIVDEPKHYPLSLSLGEKETQRIFYFHWYNLGTNELNMLQDTTVKKDVVFLTQYQMDDFLEKSKTKDNKTLNAVVLDNFLENPNYIVKKEKDNITRVLFIGRISEEKNVARTVRIFNKYHEMNPNSVLTIVGSGILEREIKNLVKSTGLINSVKFTGNLLFPYNSEYLKKPDIALLTPNRESYGLVFPELISRGIPVVTVDAPYGPSNWIKENENGILAPFESTDEEVADKMKDFLALKVSPQKISSTIDIDEINENTLKTLKSIIR